MEVNVSFIFGGNCSKAVAYYEKVFDVKAKKVLQYKDVAEIGEDNTYPIMRDAYRSHSKKNMNLIRIAVLEIGGVTFRLLDIVDDVNLQKTERVACMIIDTEENVKKYYKNMVKLGGSVYVPPRKRFCSSFHAIVADKFGTVWTFAGNYTL